MIKNCSLKKMHFKTALSKKISQYCSLKKMHFKKTFQNCSFKKCISKTHVKLPHVKLSIGNNNQNPVGLKAIDM